MNCRESILAQLKDKELGEKDLITLLPDFSAGEIKYYFATLIAEGTIVSRQVNGVIHVSLHDKEEKNYIVCLSLQMARFSPNNVSEGSINKICCKCGKEVILSRSGQKMMAENPNSDTVCMGCVEVLQKEKADLKMGVVPGALEEALKHIKGK